MQNSNYDLLNLEEEQPDSRQWKFTLRQLFVCSGTWVQFFVLGLCFGSPTVFIPQIRKEANSTAAVSLEMESWLVSVHGYSSIPYIFIIPILSQMLGRKVTFIIVCINTTVCFIIFYWSSNTVHLLISEIFQGMLLASNINLLLVIITEYSSPQNRGIFMTIESSIFFWGIWVANATGTFFHWKNIGLIAFGCCGFCTSAFFWPESPSWLAMKGRFDECATSHYWLFGHSTQSKKELIDLINTQKSSLKEYKERKTKRFRDKFRAVIEMIKRRRFYEPLLLCIAVISLYQFSGKLVCTMYAVKLIHQITKDEYTGYMGMLILEGVTILGMQIGCFLSKYLKRRTLLLLFSVIGITFLYIVSLHLYLINLGVLVENKYVSISLLTMFSVTISMGPMIISCSLFGELVALSYKPVTLVTLCLYSELLTATVLKIAPHIFEYLTLHGAFLFYGITSSIFTIILWIYLPETKDKTLSEIEQYFKDRTKSNDNKYTVASSSENKSYVPRLNVRVDSVT